MKWYALYPRDFIRWFCTKLFSQYAGVEDEEELKKLHKEWAPKSLAFILDLGMHTY